MADAGLTVTGLGEQLQVGAVRFGSRAAKARIEQGYDIVSVKVPNERINAHWFYLPGLAIVILVWLMQGWHSVGKVSQRATWDPAKLGAQLKTELAKGLTQKENIGALMAEALSA